MTILVAILALQETDEDYHALVAQRARNRAAAQQLMRIAVGALDDGKYERAVALAKEAHGRRLRAAKAHDRLGEILRGLVPALLAKLDGPEANDEASKRLGALGPPALCHLARLRPGLKGAAAARVDDLLGGATVEAKGIVRQWAEEARASSEWTDSSWAAKQATGRPDTKAGSASTSWCAHAADGGEEWLRLKYRVAVRVSRVRVRETVNPGGVVAVDVIGLDGERRRAWSGARAEAGDAEWFEIDLKGEEGREIVLLLDTKRSLGWEEIDAVELIGEAVEE